MAQEASLGLGADYYKLGVKAGKKALQIFEGVAPKDIPIETLKKFDLVLNMKTAKKIGVNIPLKLLRIATKVVK